MKTLEMNDTQITERVNALAKHLGIEASEINDQLCDHYGMTSFRADGCEYAIGNDDEATEAAKLNIKDSAWAFTPSFLSSFCDLPEEVFTCLQSKCEDANEPVLSLIAKSGGFDKFADEAISCDGRGHFMSSYDGEENEQDGYYIYRLN